MISARAALLARVCFILIHLFDVFYAATPQKLINLKLFAGRQNTTLRGYICL